MRKHNIIYLIFFALTFLSCNDPVFWAISQEVKPIKPRIPGTPTNFAVYKDSMYVASGYMLHSYNKGTVKPFWAYEIPGGMILQIASTSDYLYALCSTDKNIDGMTVIRRYDGSSWTPVYYNNIQAIYQANDTIFLLVSVPTPTTINYNILYFDSSETVQRLTTNNSNDGQLNGAAWNGTSYFLSTEGKGVYKLDGSYAVTGPFLQGQHISGIIDLQDNNHTILIITRQGRIYSNNNINESFVDTGITIPGSRLATGALAIWRNPSTSSKLLLVGRQDSGYSISSGYAYGYLELELDDNGIKSGAFKEPGLWFPTTVIGNERYQSTIGAKPVNHLFQAPPEIDGNMTLFASTQKDGVWSYRNRNGIPQWNGEGANEPVY